MRAVMRHAIAALAFAILAVSANVQAQPGDPGMGSWKLNAEKSKFGSASAPKGLTTRFEPSGSGVKWTSERIGDDGKPSVAEYTASFDGKDYPIKGSTTADTVVLRRINANTTERVNKKDGKVVSTETREVAKDGKSYVTTVKGTNAKGEPIDIRMVFDKQ